MKKPIAKKTIILYVLIILKKGTDRDHPTTPTHIVRVLNSMHVPCDRKTVARNIDYLIDFGCPIVKIRGYGIYYKNEQDTLFNF